MEIFNQRLSSADKNKNNQRNISLMTLRDGTIS